ncbi:MAG: DUF2955 domain-containing protein [Halieaceae bacterium]|jgi:hypothetical protein|nr:DUF2955 domain-containing protein [Halieaceae bacterium]
MPTEAASAAARRGAECRALRFALSVALALAAAYAIAFPLPYLAPLFAVFLSAMPGPPPRLQALLGLVLVMVVSLTVGVLLIPLLHHYPFAAVLVVAAGLYLSMYLTVIRGKRMLGLFLTVGFTLISVAGYLSQALATALIGSLVLAIVTAVLCQWLVYALLPDPAAAAGPAEAAASEAQSNWLALRATLIVLPAYLLALSNPQQYLMTIMKSVSLGQEASVLDARHAGRELLGSTFAGGLLAVLLWSALSIHPSLWMYTLWMAAASLYVGCKLFRVLQTTVAPSFWINAIVTMLILLGPAVEDSASGRDALSAFALRFATFVGVTLYAWLAIAVLEAWRERRLAPAPV